MLMVLPRSANETFVIADSFLTACSELGKGSGIVWQKWWNQVTHAHSLYKYFSCYLDKGRHPILWSIWHPAMFFIHYPMRDAVAASFFYCNFLKSNSKSLFFRPQVLWWGKGGAPLFNVLLLLVLSRAHLLVHPAPPLRHRQVGEGGGLRKGNTATSAQLSWRIFSSLAYKTFAQMWSMSAYAENEISFSHNVNYETKVFCWGCSTYFHQTTWEALETLQDIQTWGKSICFL